MAPYSQQTEVEGEFKEIEFTVDTFVTPADITRFIDEADALIDSYLGARYVIPITQNASSVALMRLFSVTLVADRIKKIQEVKQATNTEANQDVRGAFSSKDVLKALIGLKKGESILPGAELILNSGKGVITSYNSENCIQPVFRKDKEQW